jgi:exo-beta-1,3-glucanase (GH17 family)/cellulose synthase/poly-beta-1,6-N-acetylglucosamine synthase-like glycosyltransferase
MRRLDVVSVPVIAALTIATWAFVNRPLLAPEWPDVVAGFAFSPARVGQNLGGGVYPSVDEIRADIELLAGRTRALRTYSIENTLGAIPELAAQHGLRVTPGVWLDADREANDARVQQLLEMALATPGLARVIVGNETLQRGELGVETLAARLDHVRARLAIPVSTAEPWHVWLRHPELASHVDFLTVHLLPYWEGIALDAAVDFVDARMRELAAAFPDKPIVIGEIGWPSRGRSRGDAVASRANAAIFHRRFVALAQRAGYEYFLLEAFDQPWNQALEGEVGGYWGVYDLRRRPKLALEGPIVPLPQWRALSGIAALLASAAFALLVLDARTLRPRGRLFLATVASGMGSAATWTVYHQAQQYWTVHSALGGGVLLLGLLATILILLTEAHEWAEARWTERRRRPFAPTRATGQRLPKVSVHLPAYDEPCEMMLATLRSLADLDYPDFEVIVVDNNTPDEAVWRPVETLCARLGPRFRFFHVAPLAGYKAGALNHALRRTAPDARIVAVVDSDYRVERNWLRELIPAFADPELAIVQAPQDYRDGDTTTFKAMCRAEYRGFFDLGMVTRNDRNAIIQHGTMTLIRRRVLESIGGWAQWTITEDAELGLRILEHGHRSLYIRRSYGRGLTPDNFLDYKTQRFRWALGAVQILRGHWRRLVALEPTALTPGQRYHFVAGWLPWLADGLNLLFSVAAVGWSALMVLAPRWFEAPVAVFSLLPLSLFGFRLCKVVHLYRAPVGAGPAETAHAVLAGLALVPTVGLAVARGLLGREAAFVRTPKQARRHSIEGALAASRTETGLGAVLLAAAFAVGTVDTLGGTELALWRATLVVLAIPCLAATALALISALPARRDRRRRPAGTAQAWETR